eukprot:sb/3479347/
MLCADTGSSVHAQCCSGPLCLLFVQQLYLLCGGNMNKVHPTEKERKRKRKKNHSPPESPELLFEDVLVNNFVSQDQLIVEPPTPQLVFQAAGSSLVEGEELSVFNRAAEEELSVFNRAAEEADLMAQRNDAEMREEKKRMERLRRESAAREERIVLEKLAKDEMEMRDIIHQSVVVENHSATDTEDGSEVAHQVWEEEERRLGELVTHQETILHNPTASEEDVLAVQDVDESEVARAVLEQEAEQEDKLTKLRGDSENDNMNKVHPTEKERKRKRKKNHSPPESPELLFEDVLVNNFVSQDQLIVEPPTPQLVFKAAGSSLVEGEELSVFNRAAEEELSVFNRAAEEADLMAQRNDAEMREEKKRMERLRRESAAREERIVLEKLAKDEIEMRDIIHQSVVVENHSATDTEDGSEVAHQVWEEEERRLGELVTHQETILHNPTASEDDVAVQDVDEGEVARAVLEHEAEQEDKLTKLRGESEDELEKHREHITSEEKKLKRQVERSALLRRQDSQAMLESGGIRKNLAQREAKGKLVHHTEKGLLKFGQNANISYHPSVARHLAPTTVNLAQQDRRHLQSNGCEYTKDPGNWSISKDSEYENITCSVVNPKGLTDGTGQNEHLIPGDGVMVNKTLKHDISMEASAGGGVKRHLIPSNYPLLNSSLHNLASVGPIEDEVRGHYICREGVRVQRVCAYSIPLPGNTELKNNCTHQMSTESSVINQSKGLQIYSDTTYHHDIVGVSISNEGVITQTSMRYSIPVDGDQDENSPVFVISYEGDQDSHNAQYIIPPEVNLVGGVRGAQIPSSPGKLVDRARHFHHRYKTWLPWKRAKFSVTKDCSLVNDGQFSISGEAELENEMGDFEINEGILILYNLVCFHWEHSTNGLYTLFLITRDSASIPIVSFSARTLVFKTVLIFSLVPAVPELANRGPLLWRLLAPNPAFSGSKVTKIISRMGRLISNSRDRTSLHTLNKICTKFGGPIFKDVETAALPPTKQDFRVYHCRFCVMRAILEKCIFPIGNSKLKTPIPSEKIPCQIPTKPQRVKSRVKLLPNLYTNPTSLSPSRQRVKSRVKSRPLHEEEEEEEEEEGRLLLPEDVTESECDSTHSLQPLLTTTDNMVTIANEQVTDPIPHEEEEEVPGSLVIANSEEVIEDVMTPRSVLGGDDATPHDHSDETPVPISASSPVKPGQEINGGVKQPGGVEDVVVVETGDGVEMQSLGEKQKEQLEEQREAELEEEQEEREEEEREVKESTPISSEGGEPVGEVGQDGYRTIPEGPVYDEYGNELDEIGHPIIRHTFPDTWIQQPSEDEGILVFETEDGPVRFIMNLTEGGFNYHNPPNEMRLEMDIYQKHVPTTHRVASGCEFFVDNGVWRLELESEIVNVLLRMDVATMFEFATGETLWNDSKDVTIENINRAMVIFKDCLLDDTPPRWWLAKDSHYNPKAAVFRLQLESSVENKTRNVSIHDGMTLEESKTTVSIPQTTESEVRNVKSFSIYEDSEMVKSEIKHMESDDLNLADSLTTHRPFTDSILEDQGTRHLITEGGELEGLGRRHLIAEGGTVEDVVRGHDICERVDVDNITRGHDLTGETMDDTINISRHDKVQLGQSIERPPALFDKSHFEGDIVDLKDWRLETDIKIAEPTETSKRPIRTRYLGNVTGYQPIRDQYFQILIRSVPGTLYIHLTCSLGFDDLHFSCLDPVWRHRPRFDSPKKELRSVPSDRIRATISIEQCYGIAVYMLII